MRLVTILPFFLLLLPCSTIAQVQESGAVARATEALNGLRGSDPEAAMTALIQLTETPESTLENLPEIVKVVAVDTGVLDVPLNFGMFGQAPYWHDFESKSAIILGRVSEATRYMSNADDQLRAVNIIKPLALRALAGEVVHIRPEHALRIYCYSVFDPASVVVPNSEIAAKEVTADLLKYVSESTDGEVAQSATNLVAQAAYLLPQSREEILAQLKSVATGSQVEDSVGMVDRLIRHEGEPISFIRYQEIVDTPDKKLRDFILSGDVGGNIWRSHWNVLTSRLEYSEDREEIAQTLLADEKLRLRYLLVPRPISEYAPVTDKQFFDSFVDFLEMEIVRDEGYTGWAVNGLKWMLWGEDGRSSSASRLGNSPEIRRLYGRDRIVAVMLKALDSKEPKTQAITVSALGAVAWLGESVARSVRDGLSTWKASMADSLTTSSVAAQSRLADIDRALQSADEAVAVFAKVVDSAQTLAQPDLPPIPPPTLSR